MRQAHSEPTEGQQMEASDQSQGIKLQGRLGFGLSALIGGRRDSNGGLMGSRNHELTASEDEQALCGGQFILLGFGNALITLITGDLVRLPEHA
jgi:hypothetical protein